MFVRMAKTRKTFMLIIGQNGRHPDETLAYYLNPCRGRAGPDKRAGCANVAPH